MAKYCAKCHAFCENDAARFCTECGSNEFVPAAPAPTPVEQSAPVEQPAPAPVEPAAPVQTPAPAEPVAQPAPAPVTPPPMPAAPTPTAQPAVQPGVPYAPPAPAPQPAYVPPQQPVAPPQPYMPQQPTYTPQQPVAQQPYMPQAPAPQQPYMPQQPVMQGFNQIPPAKPKKKKKTGLVIAIIAILLVIAVVVVFVLNPFGNGAINPVTKLFMSDKDYFAAIEKNDVADMTNTCAAYYDGYFLQDALQNKAYNVKCTPVFGDDLMDSIRELGEDLDLDFLNDLSFEFTMNAGDNKVAEQLLLNISGQHVLTASTLFDLENEALMLSVKELTDDVFAFDMNDFANDKLEDTLDIFAGTGSSVNRKTIEKIMPSSEKLKELATKYHGIVVDSVETVAKSTETVTVDGVTQTLTVYRADFIEKALQTALVNVLSEVKKDSEIKRIFNEVMDLAADFGADEDMFSYNDFLDSIDDAIDEVKDADTDDDNVVLSLIDYVASDKLVGRTVKASGETLLEYVTVEDGNRFASEFEMRGETVCKAEGTRDGDRITGTYTLYRDDETACEIELTNFDEKAFKSGTVDGKIRITPSEDTLDEVGSDTLGSVSSLMDFAVEIESTGSGAAGGSFTLSVLNGSKSLFSVKMEYSVTDGRGVEDLNGNKVNIDFSDSESLQKALGNLHFDEIVDNLRKTSVPEEYVDFIEKRARQLVILLQRGS